MYLTALTQVTRTGCEIPRSTNPLMKIILARLSTLNEAEITF